MKHQNISFKYIPNVSFPFDAWTWLKYSLNGAFRNPGWDNSICQVTQSYANSFWRWNIICKLLWLYTNVLLDTLCNVYSAFYLFVGEKVVFECVHHDHAGPCEGSCFLHLHLGSRARCNGSALLCSAGPQGPCTMTAAPRGTSPRTCALGSRIGASWTGGLWTRQDNTTTTITMWGGESVHEWRLWRKEMIAALLLSPINGRTL